MAYITLNKNNFFNNLDIIAKKTSSKDKIAIVLKDNAYGHGLQEIAKLSQTYGLSKAVVQTQEEANDIKKYFEYILVLADIPQKSSKKIRYTINDINSIEKFPKNTLIELKVDTGMHRNGIDISDIEEAFHKIQKAKLILEAVFTHHRCSDELTSQWFWQNKKFEDVKIISKKLAKELRFKNLRFHSANSASFFRTKNFNEDMLRVGLACYGYVESNFLKVNLNPVLSIHLEKNSSRLVKKGQSIGYGATYSCEEDTIISNYDFGYGSGFLRQCSNNYITKNKEKLVGRISMDNSSFISNKDEIVLFDNAREIAKSANTIVYEILTSLKHTLKKVII
jgi:alanine racemase